MKTTISKLRRLEKDGRTIIRFSVTFTWEEDGHSLSETHKGVIAGVGKAGPWIRPPQPNRLFQTTFWSNTLKAALLAGLQRHKLLDGLEKVWPDEESEETFSL